MPRSILFHPDLVWVVLLAALSTQAAWPPRGWKGWLLAAAWLLCAAVVLLRVVLR